MEEVRARANSEGLNSPSPFSQWPTQIMREMFFFLTQTFWPKLTKATAFCRTSIYFQSFIRLLFLLRSSRIFWEAMQTKAENSQEEEGSKWSFTWMHVWICGCCTNIASLRTVLPFTAEDFSALKDEGPREVGEKGRPGSLFYTASQVCKLYYSCIVGDHFPTATHKFCLLSEGALFSVGTLIFAYWINRRRIQTT